MKGIISEFKTFIARGNVVDMAVGIIIGTAFTAIVNSLVQGVFMPIIGILVGGINFSDLKLVLKPAAGEVAEVAILYGDFIQQLVNFLIIALVVFLMVKFLNSFRRKQEEAPAPEVEPVPSKEEVLLTEIRDILKEK